MALSADWQKRVTVRRTVYESALLVTFRSPMRMRMLTAIPREAPVFQPGSRGAFIRDAYLWPTAPKASECAVLHRTLLGNLRAASLAIDLLNAMYRPDLVVLAASIASVVVFPVPAPACRTRWSPRRKVSTAVLCSWVGVGIVLLKGWVRLHSAIAR
ncbi:hypothetical protein GCM10020295_36530 [Streptomyces cinereospinus]